MIYSAFDTSFGMTLAAIEDDALCHIWFPNQKHAPDASRWLKDDSHALFQQLQQQLNEYANGQRTSFDLPLSLNGTDFQLQVWELLQSIPFGEHTSYGAMAQQLGRPKSARAVGAAVGKNPIGIVIPCHRVLGGNGSLTGFAAGLSMKEKLLAIEGQNLTGESTAGGQYNLLLSGIKVL